jgi:NAD(P)H dehydrogenase (quinone)
VNAHGNARNLSGKSPGDSAHENRSQRRERATGFGHAQLVGISRTPDKIATGIEARFGDFAKPESLQKAFAGLDRVLLIPTMDMSPSARGVQHTAAVEAAVKAGVGHIVFFSSLGTRWAEVPHLWETYFRPEQALMRTANRWTILRMAYYMESLIQEAQMSLANGVLAATAPTAVNFVARDALAAAAAGLLATADRHHGVIYQGTGPESLGAEQRAAILSKAAGKRLAFVQVTPEQLREALRSAGLPPPIVDAVVSIKDMWATGGFDVITGEIERLAGRKPCSLSEFAAAAFTAGRS